MVCGGEIAITNLGTVNAPQWSGEKKFIKQVINPDLIITLQQLPYEIFTSIRAFSASFFKTLIWIWGFFYTFQIPTRSLLFGWTKCELKPFCIIVVLRNHEYLTVFLRLSAGGWQNPQRLEMEEWKRKRILYADVYNWKKRIREEVLSQRPIRK